MANLYSKIFIFKLRTLIEGWLGRESERAYIRKSYIVEELQRTVGKS